MAAGCPESDAPLRPRSVVPPRQVPQSTYDRIQFTDEIVDAEHLNRMQNAIERALRRAASATDSAIREVTGDIETIIDHGGGVVGGGPVPVTDWGEEWISALGTEEIAIQVPVNLGGLTATIIALRAALFVRSDAGTATFRVYLGGTYGNIDGDLVATTTATSSTLTPKPLTGNIINPGGVSIVTVTIRSSGVGVVSAFNHFNGTLG